MQCIVINGKFFSQRVTGVQRYARELLSELDSLIGEDLDISLILAVPSNVSVIPTYNHIKVIKVGHLKGTLWEQISLPLFSARKGVLLNLCNASPILSPGIVCIHDMKIKARPGDFTLFFRLWYNLLFRNATSRAKRIVTVSEFSKKEIIKYYKVDSEKISVVPNAWQHYESVKYDENTLCRFDLNKYRYYFSISSLEPNKNFKWIAEVAKNNPEAIFVVAGSINNKIFTNNLGFVCPRNMKLLGYVSDSEAKTLMRDCTAFLYPSFYEGFGIPPLEALSSGTEQIIVSDLEIMHEIFGDEATYINPLNYTLPKISKTRNRDAILSKFSWNKSALILFNSIIKN